ncbi:MAG: mechanosensitive ion channel family protein [Caldilineaceae bacterium]
MQDEGLRQTDTLITILRDQVEYLLAMLVRPVVREQLMVVLLIVFISSLLPYAVRRWRRRRGLATKLTELEDAPHRRRMASAAYYLVAPILALLLLHIAIRLYALRGLPDGLLFVLQNVIWFWLGYRVIVMLLYAIYGESSKPYRHWIVTPIFVILVGAQILAVLPGSVTLVDATISLGSARISFGGLLTALLALYLFIIAGWVVSQMMMHWLPRHISAEQGVIDSVATLARYALMAVGILVSLSLMGLDFTSLAIIAGGLSVGIGIGMQDFVANFISGLVLLFEQSLRPGDVVEIEDRICRVQNISLRATTVRTLMNQELIIPNSTFTSQQVTNLTKSDRQVRVLVPLSVSYGSSPSEVREVATQAALQHPLVLPDPPPFLAFLGYGESSLDFNLSVSVDQPDRSGRVRSDLYYLLWDAFSEHGIVIPFPQRVVSLGSGWEKLNRYSSDPPVASSAGDHA